MRIGFDAKRFFNNKSGLGNYSRSVIYCLQNFDQKVNSFILFHNKKENKPDGIELFFPKKKSRAWRQWGISKDILAQKIDVFHGLSNEIPLRLKVPAVVTIHDVIFKKFPGHYRWFDRKIYHWKTKYALKNAKVILATSETTKKDILKYYKVNSEKIQVIYQSAEPAFYEAFPYEKPLHSKKYFIYVSSFQHRKNHATLLEAFEKIKLQIEEDLILVGLEGETLEFIQKLISDYKLTDRVHLKLNVSNSEKINYLHNASGFIYPSLDEGFGIPLAEAFLCNVPVAISRIPIFIEIAENAAIYFHPNKSEEMASAMLQLGTAENRKQFYDNKDKILQKFDPKNISQQLISVYKRVAL